MMFGLNTGEIEAARRRAAETPYDPARDSPAGFFEGSLDAIANIPETSSSGLLLAGNIIGGKLYGEQEGDEEFRSDLVDIQKRLRPDPATTGMLGQVIYGLGKILPQAVAGGVAGGPIGAGALVGVTQGIEEAERLKSEGVDPQTAFKAGTIEGITQGVGVVIPASLGTKLSTRLLTGSALNIGLGGFQRGSVGHILKENGYEEMAAQYRILDGAALLVDGILGGIFGAAGGPANPKLKRFDPVNENTPGDLDLGLAANDVRQFEIDSAPGIPTDLATRNAHAKAMDIGTSQLLSGREVDLGGTLENTTFLNRTRNEEMAEAFRNSFREEGIDRIIRANMRREEAQVDSVINRMFREAGRTEVEANSVSPLFARVAARFEEAFGGSVLDRFNRNLLEIRTLDEQNRVVALGNNVSSLLADVNAIRRGEAVDPSIQEAVTDFGDRLDQLGLTPEEAGLLAPEELLERIYTQPYRLETGTDLDQVPNIEVTPEEDGVKVRLKQPVGEPRPEFQQQITDRLMQAPAVEKSPLGFVSKMERVLGEKLNNSGTPDQFKQQLDAFQKSGQFKPDERFWSGIDDFLDNMKEMDGPDVKLTKQDINDFLTNNRFKLTEYGEDEVGGGPVAEPIGLRDFNEESHIEDPDDSFIRENARDFYEEDIRKEKEEENAALPEDEQKSQEELDREIEEEAYDRALESYNEDPYNVVNEYNNTLTLPDGTDIYMEIRSRSDGDYVEYMVGDRDWREARGGVDDAIEEIQLAIAEDYGVRFDDEGEVPFEEWTGEGGTNYRFFRLATDELKGGEFTKTGHYPEKNVLLHMRTKDRVGPNGEKMLFIEEIQSDLHQQAYSSKRETGVAYKTDVTPEMRQEATARSSQAEAAHSAVNEKLYDAELGMNEAIKSIAPDLPDHGVREVREVVVETIDKLRDARDGNEPANTDEIIEWGRNRVNTFVDTTKIYNAITKASDSMDETPNAIDFGVARIAKQLLNETERDYTSGAGTFAEYPWMQAVADTAKTKRENNSDSKGALEDIDKAEQFLFRQPQALIVPAEKMRQAFDKALGKYRDETTRLLDEQKESKQAINKASKEMRAFDDAPPGAPFSKTWREVGLKRLLVRAAEEGYESVGWTTGTQQNFRYNLSNFIEGLNARKEADGSYIIKSERSVLNALRQAAGRDPGGVGFIRLEDAELEAVLGRDGAGQVRAQATEEGADVDFSKSIEVESGAGSKTALYDNVIPIEAGKIFKKLDPSIKPTRIEYPMAEVKSSTRRDFNEIWYAKLTEQAKNEIMQGFELFQQERGAIVFNRASAKDFEGRLKKVIIEFTESADESTAIHEFSHWATATHRMYADLARKRLKLGDESPEIQSIADDWETLKKEVGAKDDVFTREQEEQIATWFEGYARTGEAPSERLKEIFDRFREWLTKIYNDITGRGMEPSPAVKSVFDRWLADADEISAMRAKEAPPEGGAGPSEPGATPEQSAVDPVQQILAEKPELTIADESGQPISAQDAIAQAEREVTQAQQDAKLFDVAVNCFLRYSDA